MNNNNSNIIEQQQQNNNNNHNYIQNITAASNNQSSSKSSTSNGSSNNTNTSSYTITRHNNMKQFMQNHLNLNDTHQNLQQQQQQQQQPQNEVQQQHLTAHLKNCSNLLITPTPTSISVTPIAAGNALVVADISGGLSDNLTACSITSSPSSSSNAVNTMGMDSNTFMYQQQLKQF